MSKEDQKQTEAYFCKVEAMKVTIFAFIDTVEAALYNFDNKNKGGQHVQYHGDFASIAPSTAAQLRWWAARFKECLNDK